MSGVVGQRGDRSESGAADAGGGQRRLRRFLDRSPARPLDRATWPRGQQLEIACAECAEVPPLEFVTSVRAVVLAAQGIAVIWDPFGPHVLVGGRRDGEAPLVALRREIREELGATIEDDPEMLGFVHFHHTTARPPDHLYPYPDFINIVYRARSREVPRLSSSDPYVERSEILAPAEVRGLTLPAYELFFLDLALGRA